MDENIERQTALIREIMLELAIQANSTQNSLVLLSSYINSTKVRQYGESSIVMDYLRRTHNKYIDQMKLEKGVIPDKIELPKTENKTVPERKQASQNLSWRQKCLELKYREKTGENFMEKHFKRGDLYDRICSELEKELNAGSRVTASNEWGKLKKYIPGKPDVLAIKDIKDIERALPSFINDLKVIAQEIKNSPATTALINEDIKSLQKNL